MAQESAGQSEIRQIHETLGPERQSAEPAAEGLVAEQVEKYLPVMPDVKESSSPELLKELLAFFRNPRAGASGEAAPLPVPALLHPYRDLSAIRHEYPLCLVKEDGRPVLHPLSALVDQALEEIGEEGEAFERASHHFRQLERSLRCLNGKSATNSAGEMLDAAVEKLLRESRLTGEKAEEFRSDLEDARERLKNAERFVSCGSEATREIFKAALARSWENQAGPWREEVEGLVRGLEDLLSADYSHSPEAASPEHLQDALGRDEEVDLDAFSNLLKDSRLGDPLPESRAARIRESLSVLNRIKPVFNDPGEMITVDPTVALENYERRMEEMVEFFKAAYIARLEISGRYRESQHDPVFEQFGRSDLTKDERELCPPIALSVNVETLDAAGKATLMEILAGDKPVKVLLQTAKAAPGQAGDWVEQLAKMAIGLNNPFVLQSSVSQFSILCESLQDGISHLGPALFSIFAGTENHQSGIPAYLASAAGMETRFFPYFAFDPGKGECLADCFDLSSNPHVDRAWSGGEFVYLPEEGEGEQSVDLDLTPADCFLCDENARQFFWNVPAEKWHQQMIPVSDFLALDDQEAKGRVPYILAVDDFNRVCRVAVSRPVIEAAQTAARRWRYLQELGGVNNSHALRLLEKETRRLEEEKQSEIAAVEQRYADELDQNIESLTGEIVQRIASQLLDESPGGGGAVLPFSTPKAAPAPLKEDPSVEQEEEAGEEKEEPEELLTFDDPYIETPRCTSCNECTKINSRLFVYNENKQAYIGDKSAGTFEELVRAAELCPVRIIHPGNPDDPDAPGMDALIKRAAPFN